MAKKGTKIDAQDNQGKTALHYAAQNNNETMVNFLVKNQASVNIHNNRLKAPNHLTQEDNIIYIHYSEDTKKRTSIIYEKRS